MKFINKGIISLVDWDKYVVLTLFTAGCNFRCEYCHNASLIKNWDMNSDLVDKEEVFKNIEKKKWKIDAINITGGEPTLWGDSLISFIKECKERFPHLKIKVDTNGSNPAFFNNMDGLIDYIALDIKSTEYHRHPEILNNEPTGSFMKDTIGHFKKFNGELRITGFRKYIDINNLSSIILLLCEIDNNMDIPIYIQKVNVQEFMSDGYEDNILDCSELNVIFNYFKRRGYNVIKRYNEELYEEGICQI